MNSQIIMGLLIPHLHMNAEKAEGVPSKFARTTMMVLAVTLHNIPEGMAVGIMYTLFAGRKNPERRRILYDMQRVRWKR